MGRRARSTRGVEKQNLIERGLWEAVQNAASQWQEAKKVQAWLDFLESAGIRDRASAEARMLLRWASYRSSDVIQNAVTDVLALATRVPNRGMPDDGTGSTVRHMKTSRAFLRLGTRPIPTESTDSGCHAVLLVASVG